MIETARLILRPFREGDAEDVFEYLEKPTVNCFACMKVHSLEEAQGAVKEKMSHSEYCFAIVLQTTGKVIGEIEAYPESSQPDAAENFVKDTFSPCWMLNPAYQGKGYAFEAAHGFQCFQSGLLMLLQLKIGTIQCFCPLRREIILDFLELGMTTQEQPQLVLHRIRLGLHLAYRPAIYVPA